MTTDGLCWYMTVADVSGKGVPAALIMSIVRSLLHTFVDLETAPDEVLTRVNRKLSADLEPEMFVTIAVIRLDPMSHTVELARGGHEPLLLRRADGEIERLEPPGAALGILDIDTFEKGLEHCTLSLEENDTLVMYTDGVTEARDARGEEFGIERLESLLAQHGTLPAADLLDEIRAAVQSFSAGVTQHDDITLVILRREGE